MRAFYTVIAILTVVWLSMTLQLMRPLPVQLQAKKVTLNTHQDSTLLADAHQLGLRIPPVMNLYLEPAIPPADDLPNSQEVAVFYSNNDSIYIRSNQDNYQILNQLSYEYMHWVWQTQLTLGQQTTVITASQELLTKHAPDLTRQLMPFWDSQTSNGEINDETDSIICTRISPSELPDQINTYCNHFIPNRLMVLF